MLCPTRQTPAERRRNQILNQLNKIGGPDAAKSLLREHYSLQGSRLEGTATPPSGTVTPPAPTVTPPPTQPATVWANQAKAAYLAQNPGFAAKLNSIFPGAQSMGEFVADATASLAQYDFKKGNAIAMVSVCRDELTRPFVDAIEALWGNSFSLGSIAAMIFTGTTGLGAGMHHAPETEPNDEERFVFFVAPHIAIGADGTVGAIWRPNVPTISNACGSLAGFLKEMNSGTVNFQLVITDLEQSMMKGQMSTYFKYGTVPALEDLTKDAQKLILYQLQQALGAYPNLKGTASYAVLSGVQVHGPAGGNFIWPTDYYVINVDGSRTDVGFGAFGQGLGKNYMAAVTPYSF